MQKFDVIVIGTGAGGGPAIDCFVQAGMNVAAIERGDFIKNTYPFGDELYHILKRDYVPKKSRFPIEYLDSKEDVVLEARNWTSHAVGGGTLLWYGHLLRLKEEDFKMKSLFGHHDAAKDISLQDWPVPFEDYIEYYASIEEQMELYSPFKTDLNDSNLRPPILNNTIDNLLIKGLRTLNLNPYKTPTCLGGNAYDLRPINPISGETINTKFTESRKNSANTYIEPHISKENFTIFTNTIADKILYENKQVTGVKVFDCTSKKDKILYAPKVIVSCNAIESALLFLRSKVPNKNDLIGRHLTYLTDCTARFIIPNPKENYLGTSQEMLGTLTVDDYYLINDEKYPNLFKGGKISFSERRYDKGPITFGLSVDGWGEEWKKKIYEYQSKSVIHLSFKGEAMPLFSNRVTFGNTKDHWNMLVPKLVYKLPQHDINLANYMGNKLKEIAYACGARESDIKVSPRITPIPGHGHLHGTLRFGDDPNTSVLNRFCESHDITGLYALDGSFMPTSGGINTSLTIMANSLRVAKHITKN